MGGWVQFLSASSPFAAKQLIGYVFAHAVARLYSGTGAAFLPQCSELVDHNKNVQTLSSSFPSDL